MGNLRTHKFDEKMWKELFGVWLMSKSGDVVTEEALAGKTAVGIYFSAHRCPPCQTFTPVLVKKYEALKKAGKNLEIVFVSCDQNEGAFDEYYKEMPWLALSYDKKEFRDKLADKYECKGIPHFVILNGNDASTITLNGRGGVNGKNYIEDFPYAPKPMYDVSESMDGIAKGHSFLLVQNYASEETKKANSEILLDIAINQKDLFHRFFTVNEETGPTKFIHTQTGGKWLEKKPDFELVRVQNKSCKYQRFGCDRCGTMGGQDPEGERMHNVEHSYDMKIECCNKDWPVHTEADKVPYMVILYLANEEYYAPHADYAAFSKANVEKFAQELKDKKLTAIKLGQKA